MADIDINGENLDERLAELESSRVWSPRVVSKFEALIRTGDDLELFRVNPMRYATTQSVEESESIDLFLYAAKAGLFTIDWLIVCAACSNVFTSFRKLENLDPHFTCTLCAFENEADLDDYIQVTFTIAPEVRRIRFHDPGSLAAEELLFRYHFSADVKPLPNGLTVPEVLQKWTRLLCSLEAGESRSVDLDLPPGLLGIWDVLGSSSAMFIVDPGDGDGGRLDLELSDGEMMSGVALGPARFELPEGRSFYLSDGGDDGSADVEPDTEEDVRSSMAFTFPAIGHIAAGPVSVELHNGRPERTSAWIVEYPPVPDQAALVEFLPVLTAKKLLSNQTFRRLFRSETVPVSESLKVRDLTYLFTDLKDSTLMYDTVGDVSAYDLVRRHFDALVEAVSANSGAVVKTVGDAIMATFVSPEDGVRAALEMLSALDEFNRAVSAQLMVKIGLHRGHSIAVTVNDRLDYFGQNVNIAARVQQLAEAGEIVVSADVIRNSEVAELIAPHEVIEESEIMKGVGETIPVFRIRVT